MGFPNRVSRTTFGPKLKNKWPIVNPEQDIGDSQFNLLFHQTAGMNVVCSNGLLSVTVSQSGDVVTGYQGFSWDPNGSMPKIAWTRLTNGIYTFAIPSSTYPDENGNQIPISIIGGMVVPQSSFGNNLATGHYVKTGVRSGQVHVYLGQSFVDSDFLCILW